MNAYFLDKWQTCLAQRKEPRHRKSTATHCRRKAARLTIEAVKFLLSAPASFTFVHASAHHGWLRAHRAGNSELRRLSDWRKLAGGGQCGLMENWQISRKNEDNVAKADAALQELPIIVTLQSAFITYLDIHPVVGALLVKLLLLLLLLLLTNHGVHDAASSVQWCNVCTWESYNKYAAKFANNDCVKSA